MEKKCSNCKFKDEYFGDCCHPRFGPAKIFEAVIECLEEEYAYWEPVADDSDSAQPAPSMTV